MSPIQQTHSSDGYDAKDLEVAKGAYETTSSNLSSVRLGDSDGGVFATGGNVEAYKPIDEYEGAHRYDPLFEWTEKEERSLVRRVCWGPLFFLFPFLFFLFFHSFSPSLGEALLCRA